MRLAIYGYGGHAREVAVQINEPVDFFVADEFLNEHTKSISLFDPKEYMLMIAIADPKEREKIVNKLPKKTVYFNFIHPSAQIMDKNIKIGIGSFVGANCVLTTNIKIGDHAILNRGIQIGHDTVIGDYFSAMPGSTISGNVTIGNRIYIGTNATVIQKIQITDDVTIGANGVVVKNINQSGTYVGVPCKKIK